MAESELTQAQYNRLKSDIVELKGMEEAGKLNDFQRRQLRNMELQVEAHERS